MRIRQEILLGVGGARALKTLGVQPTVYHMNEGHSAFLIVERIRDLMASHGLTFAQAREVVLAPASSPPTLPSLRGTNGSSRTCCGKYSSRRFAAGDPVGGVPRPGPVGHPAVERVRDDGVRTPVVGVRERRGKAPRRNLPGDVKELWPELPEGRSRSARSPTGSTPVPGSATRWRSCTRGYFGRGSSRSPRPCGVGADGGDPPGELWRIHQSRRERLVFFARKRLKNQLRRQGAGVALQRAGKRR